ncbi:hypothetical protein MMC18_000713 [Xylographa bjoerkii]|nr:hypothetical protein [Xylographa bjoerkii]
MSSSKGNSTTQRARDSLGSLLDYYYERPASQESIKIALKVGEVPSTEQAEALKKELKEALQVQEILDNLSPQEKENMSRMANLSRGRRAHKNN